MFKLIIDSGEQVAAYEFRNTYDQIAQYFRHDFKEINPHLICEKFHQLNRPMLGLLWLDLVGSFFSAVSLGGLDNFQK